MGWFAGLISVAALVVAFLAPLYHEKTLRRAFARLEGDFEELQEKVNTHLGRISRLKREMTLADDHQPGGPGPVRGPAVSASAEPGGARGGSIRTRTELLREIQRRGKTFYDQPHQTGPDVG